MRRLQFHLLILLGLGMICTATDVCQTDYKECLFFFVFFNLFLFVCFFGGYFYQLFPLMVAVHTLAYQTRPSWTLLLKRKQLLKICILIGDVIQIIWLLQPLWNGCRAQWLSTNQFLTVRRNFYNVNAVIYSFHDVRKYIYFVSFLVLFDKPVAIQLFKTHVCLFFNLFDCSLLF